MSCFGCSKKYGLFCKEYGCPNCGYSYCSKCLKRPISVPKHGGKVENVCLICFDKLSKLQATENIIDCDALPGRIVTKSGRETGAAQEAIGTAEIFEEDPPADLGAVLAPLPIPPTQSSPANTASKHTGNDEIVENLDRVISKRLKNLKTVDNLPTDDEMRARLADLNGMPNKDYSRKELFLSTDQRTDQQKMNDLLEQFMGEAQLDQRMGQQRTDTITEIERRLLALRDGPVDRATLAQKCSKASLCTDTPSDNEQDEETMLKDIIEKYLAESHLPATGNELEAELMSSIPKPPPGSVAAAENEELPWCNICNEDAIYRCKGCDGELFCVQCFRECHDDDEEYRLHPKENYSAPPKFKEDHF